MFYNFRLLLISPSDIDDFVVPDDEDSDAAPISKKRKRPAPKASKSAKRASPGEDEDIDIPDTTNGTTESRTANFSYQPRKAGDTSTYASSNKNMSAFTNTQRAVANTPKKEEERYPWLANVKDKDGHKRSCFILI